jgi:xanthine dehydrogenase accessory factor
VSTQSEFAELTRQGRRAALVTAVSGARAGARMLVRPDGGHQGTRGSAELDSEALNHAELMCPERSELRGELFVDVSAPPPRVLIFGAVQYAADLASLARAVGWRPYVIDPRAQFATIERFPDAEQVVVAWPEAAVAQLGGIDRATYIVVLTHDPKIDDQVLTLALSAEPAYIGAMGSKRAQAERRERLLAAGVSESELRRIAAPIGLDLGATSSAEVALSIMAELVAVRHGRGGGGLSQRAAAKIH